MCERERVEVADGVRGWRGKKSNRYLFVRTSFCSAAPQNLGFLTDESGSTKPKLIAHGGGVSILHEIHSWAQSLPLWQQDAVGRLYGGGELTDGDLDGLLALAKAEAGIEDPEGRTASALEDADVAALPVPTRLVQLASIKDVANVNALAQGVTLPFSPTGITVVYGENGAGKSGYARILKHACRARDKAEAILPNARLEPGEIRPASAVFEVFIDGESAELAWDVREAAPEPLSEIAIFDTRCARAYIDNEGDFAYVPYGLDILAGLVAVCNALKERARQEKTANAPSNTAYVALLDTSTKVGRVLTSISGTTRPEEVEALAKLSANEEARLNGLTKALAEAHPKQKAQADRQRATRFENLAKRIDEAIDVVSDTKLKELRELIDASTSAKTVAALAAQNFVKTPGQLPGTGGEEWKILFDAARAFSEISHKSQQFPDLGEDSACPLCQNELGSEGVRNLKRLDAFIKEKVEQTARDAREKAKTAYRSVEQERLELLIDESLSQELTEVAPELAAACQAMQTSILTRKKETLDAAAGKIEWSSVDVLPDDPRPDLREEVKRLRDDATALDAAIDESARAAMLQEHLELDARKKLAAVKDAVLEAIAKHGLCDRLQRCIDGMSTTGISRKSTELTKTLATEELIDGLNDELQRLKVRELRIAMRPESPGGRTQFKLILQWPGEGTPSSILSEGEQRAIAIASFLAEVRLGGGRGGVVFDDPVSSLDHRRRWEVAERLALEARERQVIVFTHDIYFLCILEQKAEKVGAELHKRYIRRTPAGFGAYSEALPFDIEGTKGRIGYLRNMVGAVRHAENAGDEDEQRRLTCKAYGLLRLAWERSVEEVLFNGAIERFGEGVQTQRLREVIVEDSDYREIDAGMSKSSKFEHDAASQVERLPIPDPDDLSTDIERLHNWRKQVLDRRQAVAAQR